MVRRARRRRRAGRDALLLDAGDGGAAVPRRPHRGAGAVMWSRAGASLVAGFILADALVGLVGWALPGPWQSTIVPGLMAFFPLWFGAAGTAFGSRNGRPARAWLGGLAIAGFARLWAL